MGYVYPHDNNNNNKRQTSAEDLDIGDKRLHVMVPKGTYGN